MKRERKRKAKKERGKERGKRREEERKKESKAEKRRKEMRGLKSCVFQRLSCFQTGLKFYSLAPKKIVKKEEKKIALTGRKQKNQ